MINPSEIAQTCFFVRFCSCWYSRERVCQNRGDFFTISIRSSLITVGACWLAVLSGDSSSPPHIGWTRASPRYPEPHMRWMCLSCRACTAARYWWDYVHWCTEVSAFATLCLLLVLRHSGLFDSCDDRTLSLFTSNLLNSSVISSTVKFSARNSSV